MSALELTGRITLDEKTIKSANLCDRFSKDDLNRIGEWCFDSYSRDLKTRAEWHRRNEGALELAMQVQKDKTFPWQNCSNIIFPLVTVAAMQFHARAYPALIDGKDIVQCQVIGADPDGVVTATSRKISKHMSWQRLEQDQDWEDDTDRAMLNVAIVGCGFKKSYYDATLGYTVSRYVHAKDLVFDYWAKTIETCQTKTQLIPMYRNEIYSRVRSGAFCDILDESWYKADAAIPERYERAEQDKRDGLTQPTPNHDTPFPMLEQHCWLDLDGDGYAEPYTITFEETTHCVVRIVTRFDRVEDIKRNIRGEIISINANEYYTKVPFIPAPDGSMMDIGFGVLLGPLNESVDAAINQLFDAGTLSNTAGGFLGRGAKLRGGLYEFAPFSWNRVDSTGDDLRKSVYPLPVREPSNVMFQLLGLILQYADRISGTTEINVGENVGQNTPAETSRTMSEQGLKIYTAIYKRMWRGLKKEFQKLFQLNAVYLPARVSFGAGGDSIGREDYSGSANGIRPVADPNVSSASARVGRAQALKQLATNNPAYDVDQVELEVLKSIGISDPEVFYKGVSNAPPPQPDVRIQIQQLKNQQAAMELQFKQQSFIATMQMQARMNEATIGKMQAEITKIYAEGQAIPEKIRVDAFRASMELLREQNASIDSQIKSLMEIGSNELEARGGVGGAQPLLGMEGPPSNEAGVPALAGPSAGTSGFMG